MPEGVNLALAGAFYGEIFNDHTTRIPASWMILVCVAIINDGLESGIMYNFIAINQVSVVYSSI